MLTINVSVRKRMIVRPCAVSTVATHLEVLHSKGGGSQVALLTFKLSTPAAKVVKLVLNLTRAFVDKCFRSSVSLYNQARISRCGSEL